MSSSTVEMLDASGAPVVIVGASAAGMTAAQTLRSEGYCGRVICVDRDHLMPYERPPLSKSGFTSPHGNIEQANPNDLEQLGIEFIAGVEVRSIEPAGLEVRLSDARVLQSQAILVATGGIPVAPPGMSLGMAGIYSLRSLADRQAIGNSLAGGGSVAIIGGGLIGAECVAACLADGHQVHWVDLASLPLQHVLPLPLARFLVDALIRDGAQLSANRSVRQFHEEQGQLTAILLDDGSKIDVSTAILGIGTKPHSPAGIGNGLEILVDARQRTQFPGIFAAGDAAMQSVASGLTQRCDHWQAAQWQGMNAALAMLGKAEPVRPPVWFWSDQGDRHVEFVGSISSTDCRQIRAIQENRITSFEIESGCLVGVASVNDIAHVRAARRVLGKPIPFDPASLSDPALDPRKLLEEMCR